MISKHGFQVLIDSMKNGIAWWQEKEKEYEDNPRMKNFCEGHYQEAKNILKLALTLSEGSA